MKTKVLGLGTVAMDIVLKCNKLPEKDGTVFIFEEKLVPGGSCANVLVTLSKLGVSTEVLAKFGGDHYSKVFLEDIIAEKVSTEKIVIDKDKTLLHTFITVGENGEKCIFANLGTSLLSLTEEDVDEEMLNDISLFYTDMFPGKPALKLAKICKSKGIPVFFNLQCGLELMNLCNISREEIEEMIQLSDMFVSCKEGLFQLSGQNNHEDGLRVLYKKHGTNNGMIATCGDKGVIYLDEEKMVKVPSFKVRAVDTTGAGDAFMGGFIYSYFIKEDSIENSLRFGNVCSAIKCTQWGSRIDTDLDQVIKFYTKYR